MNDVEYWLRGPVDDVPALLQPVAHALLQVQKELHELLVDFDSSLLWKRPHQVASVGFHLNHLTGVLDRLFTYAHGETLSKAQFLFLKNEGIEQADRSVQDLILQFDDQVKKSIFQLKNIDPHTLTEIRYVGRKMLPTTVIGLLFHAAEHSTRHFGQLLVTVKLLKNQ